MFPHGRCQTQVCGLQTAQYSQLDTGMHDGVRNRKDGQRSAMHARPDHHAARKAICRCLHTGQLGPGLATCVASGQQQQLNLSHGTRAEWRGPSETSRPSKPSEAATRTSQREPAHRNVSIAVAAAAAAASGWHLAVMAVQQQQQQQQQQTAGRVAQDGAGQAAQGQPVIVQGQAVQDIAAGDVTLQPGVNLEGADLQGLQGARSAQRCLRACQRQPACVAFTFILTAGHHRPCWLKRNGYRIGRSAGTVSGIVRANFMVA